MAAQERAAVQPAVEGAQTDTSAATPTSTNAPVSSGIDSAASHLGKAYPTAANIDGAGDQANGSLTFDPGGVGEPELSGRASIAPPPSRPAETLAVAPEASTAAVPPASTVDHQEAGERTAPAPGSLPETAVATTHFQRQQVRPEAAVDVPPAVQIRVAPLTTAPEAASLTEESSHPGDALSASPEPATSARVQAAKSVPIYQIADAAVQTAPVPMVETPVAGAGDPVATLEPATPKVTITATPEEVPPETVVSTTTQQPAAADLVPSPPEAQTDNPATTQASIPDASAATAVFTPALEQAKQGIEEGATQVAETKSLRTLPKIYGPITEVDMKDQTFIDNLTKVLRRGVTYGIFISDGFYSPEDVQDHLQEALVQVIIQQERLGSMEGDLTGYLFRIARNRTIDTIRKTYANIRIPSSGFVPNAEEVLINVQTEGDFTETVVLSDLTRKILLSLSDDHRTIILLSHFEGLSTHEIATKLGIPEGTVKSRSSYAYDLVKILLLYEKEGLSYEEIGLRVGESPLSIEKKISTAQKRLKTNLIRLNINASDSKTALATTDRQSPPIDWKKISETERNARIEQGGRDMLAAGRKLSATYMVDEFAWLAYRVNSYPGGIAKLRETLGVAGTVKPAINWSELEDPEAVLIEEIYRVTGGQEFSIKNLPAGLKSAVYKYSSLNRVRNGISLKKKQERQRGISDSDQP